jgi:SagB-type dehydrogenase family enzyme
MTELLSLCLKKDIEVTILEGGHLKFSYNSSVLEFSDNSTGVIRAVELLRGNGAAQADLIDEVVKIDGLGGLTKYDYLIKALSNEGFIEYKLKLSKFEYVVLIPQSIHFSFSSLNAKDTDTLYLSKFAYLRYEHEHLVLKSPLGYAKLMMQVPGISTPILELYKGIELRKFYVLLSQYGREIILQLLEFIYNLGCLEIVNRNKNPVRDRTDSSHFWQFHDLQFHTASRKGRHDNYYGNRSPKKWQEEYSHNAKRKFSSVKKLYTPNLDKLMNSDITLTSAIENRRSIRSNGTTPISIGQLGEFLYRTARVIKSTDYQSHNVLRKPYPAGGRAYELEIYPIIQSCKDIDQGVYYYNPLDHELGLIQNLNDEARILMKSAKQMTDKLNKPQVLLIVTSRFEHLSKDYGSIAYATTLKNVGILFQTMYLVAHSMGLAICALGGGDSDIFSKLSGIDYYHEGAVGELILGSQPLA